MLSDELLPRSEAGAFFVTTFFLIEAPPSRSSSSEVLPFPFLGAGDELVLPLLLVLLNGELVVLDDELVLLDDELVALDGELVALDGEPELLPFCLRLADLALLGAAFDELTF